MHYTFTLDYFPPEYYIANAFSEASGSSQSAIRDADEYSARDSRTPFQWLHDQTLSRLAVAQATPTQIDASYARRMSLNGKIELTAQQWDIGASEQKIAQLRMVHIRGAKNEIINTWIFPLRPQLTPVFAAELIAVSGVVRVAFVDIQTPLACAATADEVRLLTALVATRFSTLPCDEPAPDWAIHASTGHYTYARNVPAELMPAVHKCYLSYFDTYLKAFGTADSPSPPISLPDQAALRGLHEYQLHHMEHSPGGNYLSKLFGTDWTASFMHSFLFATPS